ncbi:YIP1 family protein [Roseobacter sp.]|uniref:YIP1 family protein n=1 Tax=Roseobacter sp. TaxID=1907202 RepID=UPI0032977B8B
MILQQVNWPQLSVQTLRDPKAAAADIISWQIPQAALWMTAAVIAIASTLMSALSHAAIPLPAPLDTLMISPFMVFAVIAGAFVLTIYALFWTGRVLGGTGDLTDLLAVLVWMQALRAVGQALVLVAALLAPVLASFLVLFVAVATLWVFVNFISVGLRLNSLLRAVVVLIVGALVMSLGLSFLLSMFGVSAIGVPSNV